MIIFFLQRNKFNFCQSRLALKSVFTFKMHSKEEIIIEPFSAPCQKLWHLRIRLLVLLSCVSLLNQIETWAPISVTNFTKITLGHVEVVYLNSNEQKFQLGGPKMNKLSMLKMGNPTSTSLPKLWVSHYLTKTSFQSILVCWTGIPSSSNQSLDHQGN